MKDAIAREIEQQRGFIRKAVGGFLPYVQFRDQHVDPDRDGALDA
jgi:hypothetical protein